MNKYRPDTLPELFRHSAQWQESVSPNRRGAPLCHASSLPAQGTNCHIVYVPGASEPLPKMIAAANIFNDHNIGFHLRERQGVGIYSRYCTDREKQHAHDFEQDAEDIVQFIEMITDRHKDARIHLLCHSTGCVPGIMVTHDHAELIEGATLCAPLFGFKNRMLAGKEHLFAALPLPRLPRSWQERYAFGEGPWQHRGSPSYKWKLGDFSRDPDWQHIHDYWQLHHPQYRIGGPTLRLIWEVCHALTKTVHKEEWLSEIKTHVDIFTAENELLVDNRRTSWVKEHLPHASLTPLEGSHELLMERPEIRNHVIRSILSRFSPC